MLSIISKKQFFSFVYISESVSRGGSGTNRGISGRYSTSKSNITHTRDMSSVASSIDAGSDSMLRPEDLGGKMQARKSESMVQK